MAHGGKRNGSGRPQGSLASHTLQAQEYRKLAVEMITKEAKPILEALIRKAKNGDIAAIKEVNERVMGKVKDSMDLKVDSGFSLTDLLKAADEDRKNY